jgi:SAM-dependent methyltransferase
MSFLLSFHRRISRTPLRRLFEGHLAHPRGLAGIYVAAVMNQSNRGITRFTLDQVGLAQGQQVLEIGFGGGVSFDLVLPVLGPGTLHGLDRSEDMLRRARKRRKAELAAGRLELSFGNVDQLPYNSASMDRAFGVNTLYFWPDPLAGLKELHRVLKPGGRLALGLRGKSAMQGRPYSEKIFRYYEEAELRDLYLNAGFVDFRFVRVDLNGVETQAAVGSKAD